METNNDKFLRELAAGVGFWFTTVDTKEEAKEIKKLAERSDGVVRVTRRYAHGYDLKLLLKSLVVVVQTA